MAKTPNQIRREVMMMAWGLYRAEANGPNPRTFADALAGAWRWVKKAAERAVEAAAWMARHAGRTVYFGRQIGSPTYRTLRGPHRDRQLGEYGRSITSFGR